MKEKYTEQLIEKQDDHGSQFQNEKLGSFENEELEQKIRSEISLFINQNLESLKNNEITIDDFINIINQKRYLQDDYDQDFFNYSFERSWSINQITDFLNIYEEEFGSERARFLTEADASNLFITSYRNEMESDTVSDLFIQALVEKIEKEGVMQKGLQSMIRLWAQNIHMASSMDRIKLYSAVNGNPGKISDLTAHELFDSLTFYGRAVIEDLAEKLHSDDLNLSDKIAIIDVLKFAQKHDDIGFESAQYEAVHVLHHIHQNSDKYFLQKLTDENLPSQNEKIDHIKDFEIRNKTNLEPLSALGYRNQEVQRQNAEYNNFSEGYNLIYTYNGKVDSFFSSAEPDKRLSIYDILTEEGIDSDNLYDSVVSYRALLYRPIRKTIEQEFQINLADYTIREQIQFLNYLSEEDEVGVRILKRFINSGQDEEARKSRVVSFFALEQNPEIFKKLKLIDASISSEYSDIIYKEYAQIFRLSQKVYKLIKELESGLEDQEIGVVSQNISQRYLQKAHDVITKIDDLIAAHQYNTWYVFGDDNVDYFYLSDLLTSQLATFKKEAELTLEVYQHLRKNKNIHLNLEQLEGVEFEAGISIKEYVNDHVLIGLQQNTKFHELLQATFGPDFKNYIAFLDQKIEGDGEISQDEQERVDEIIQMFEMYHENYQSRPELKQKILIDFVNLLVSQTDKTELYITKQEGEVFAFCRFDKDYRRDGSGVEYAGSMNVRRKGMAIGTSFLETVFNQEKEGVPLDGHCDLGIPIASVYIEKYGFVIDKILPQFTKSVNGAEVKRRVENQQYYYREGLGNLNRQERKEDRHELMVEAHQRDNEFDIKEERFVLMFDYYPKLGDIKIMEQIVNRNGYVITRYFPDRTMSNKGDLILYVAFEKSQEKSQEADSVSLKK